MCAPMIGMVASLGIGIMSSIAQYQAARQDYEAKAAAWRQNVVNSQATARDEQRQLVTRSLQESAKTEQQKHQFYIEGAQKSALAEAGAAAGGVSGISVDNLMADIEGKAALNRTYADENYKYVAADLTEQLKATSTRMQYRIDSMQRPIAPSPWTAILGIAGAGAKFATGIGGMGGGMAGASA